MPNKRNAEQSKVESGGTRSTSPATSRSETSNSSKASSPTEQKNQVDFQFLNFSHPSEAKESRARRTVRSHVTRQQHQREHAAAAARRAQSAPQIDGEQEEPAGPSTVPHAATYPPPNRPTLQLPTRSRPSNAGSDASSQSPSPEGSPSIYRPERRINPYEVYPAEWHPYLPAVTDSYLTNIAMDMPDAGVSDPGAGSWRTRFFPFCLTDPAPLHAVVLVAACQYGHIRGPRSHAIDCLQLRDMAISEINGALKEGSRATSDQLIVAVANMAAYEAVFGDRTIFNTHMTGLLRMVSLRGGLPALGLDGLLERFLLWIDSNASHITRSNPYFDRQTFPSRAQHPRPDPQRFAGGVPRQTRT